VGCNKETIDSLLVDIAVGSAVRMTEGSSVLEGYTSFKKEVGNIGKHEGWIDVTS